MDGQDLQRRLGPARIGRQIRASIEALRQGQAARPGTAEDCRRVALAEATTPRAGSQPLDPKMERARRR